MSNGWISGLQVTQLRCFETGGLQPSASVNVIQGGNGSGKTSLLEAIYLLGRGTSFRASRTETLIRHGSGALTVLGTFASGGPVNKAGIEVSRLDGLSVRLDNRAGTRAELVQAVPVQILEPASHELVQGAPAVRRQFLDWAVFHVERGFLSAWQRYRRALQQRNAALKSGDAAAAWAWDDSLCEPGLVIDGCRRKVIEALRPEAERVLGQLLEEPLSLAYSPGWAAESSLEMALGASRERDLALGNSQVGPHRADLRIGLGTKSAKLTASRGQEKLLVAALTLAQVALVGRSVGRSVALLVDEPGADLDRRRLDALQTALWESSAQCFVTTLDSHTLVPPSGTRVFHVEHGQVSPLL